MSTQSLVSGTLNFDAAAVISFFNQAFASRYQNPFPCPGQPVTGKDLQEMSGYAPEDLVLTAATLNKVDCTAMGEFPSSEDPASAIKQLYALLFSGKSRMVVDDCVGSYEAICPIKEKAHVFLLETAATGGSEMKIGRQKSISSPMNHARAIVVSNGVLVGHMYMMCSFCSSGRYKAIYVDPRDLSKHFAKQSSSRPPRQMSPTQKPATANSS